MSVEYKIAETELFQSKLKDRQFSQLQKKLTDYIYPILKKNPFFGPTIKKLKGEFDGLYRYRIGKYRLFYLIKDKELLVVLIDIDQRKDNYK
ncbi:type II toxin-antitoxin system RelE/ParE family toxin [Leptospira santarosai]|uniref:type II toxin-antitoxin system RelE family toxin n=1 Tax=Leptospira santarosai TaxID=28183 RepID=UPI0003759B81|nr:type II toxin-antitoxin system RelE/ParE family toxin [Leptospira santarosai]MDI7185760.1 type II toxin-antitoxin system RelE/ParE family toxin [Leptospira santarosai]MDI7191089.1 type II toxin-antitoxin system RelE/ParE family toxin [Leptospira santarosai]MDI7199550.1 type II toxin-antitoxin system RelE/ParE family toxin [Leptospira santarosai]MDI7220963.1 type II toxin-antitoxin system RelE/ParE family toxin [Leptospira santarosai]MDI7225086.1 type II toxin-antitoxin system RelE/ParE fami